jgi:hypothetical protein
MNDPQTSEHKRPPLKESERDDQPRPLSDYYDDDATGYEIYEKDVDEEDDDQSEDGSP